MDQMICGMNDERFAEVIALATDMRYSFQWGYVRDTPGDDAVCKALQTCAIVLGHLTHSAGPIYEQSDHVGKLATARDTKSLEQWIYNDPWRSAFPMRGDRVSILQSLTRSIAKAFDQHGIVGD